MSISSVVKKGTVVLSALVVVPYAVSLLSNVLYGWPQSKDWLRRVLSPKKVLLVNWDYIRRLIKLKYVGVYLKSKRLHKTAKSDQLIRNIEFQADDAKHIVTQQLDIYLPRTLSPGHDPAPVIIFVYGGGWMEGERDLYASLCSRLADTCRSVVVCPDYTGYPKGFVDDMVQDVIDCLEWVRNNIEQYGGNRDQVSLVGHSAGGHLAVMAVLELAKTQLTVSRQASQGRFSGSNPSPIYFADQHYSSGGEESQDAMGESTASSFFVVRPRSPRSEESFVVLSGSKGAMGLRQRETSLPGSPRPEFLDSPSKASLETSSPSGGEDDPDLTPVAEVPPPTPAGYGDGDATPTAEDKALEEGQQGGEAEQDTAEDQKTRSTSNNGPGASRNCSSDSIEVLDPPSTYILQKRELLQSVRAVIGLAGVYDTERQYASNEARGIEDITVMPRAFYGPEHFERFSPVSIVPRLASVVPLPRFVLIHGMKDHMVLPDQSEGFASVLAECNHDVHVKLIPGCNHYDVMFDIMSPDRTYHSAIVGVIAETVDWVAGRV